MTGLGPWQLEWGNLVVSYVRSAKDVKEVARGEGAPVASGQAALAVSVRIRRAQREGSPVQETADDGTVLAGNAVVFLAPVCRAQGQTPPSQRPLGPVLFHPQLQKGKACLRTHLRSLSQQGAGFGCGPR